MPKYRATSHWNRDTEDGLRSSWILLAVLATAACVHEPEPTRKKIGFSWGGTIWGGGTWFVFDDDTITYSGFDQGARPKAKGWHWTDDDQRSGKVSFHRSGAFARATEVINEAEADPILKHTPKLKAVCYDAGQDFFWLKPAEPKPSLIVDGCLNAATAATTVDQAYFERIRTLEADLRAAMSTASLIPEG